MSEMRQKTMYIVWCNRPGEGGSKNNFVDTGVSTT